MYSMKTDKTPSKPYISSVAINEEVVARWLEENDLSSVVDADGFQWRLDVKTLQLPDPGETQGSVWKISFAVSCRANAQDFVKDGTLDEEADARLIGLLGDNHVVMQMKPQEFEATDVESARLLLVERATKLREDFAGRSLHNIKRSLVSKYIDKELVFGGRI